jgi:hypothetical protein
MGNNRIESTVTWSVIIDDRDHVDCNNVPLHNTWVVFETPEKAASGEETMNKLIRACNKPN